MIFRSGDTLSSTSLLVVSFVLFLFGFWIYARPALLRLLNEKIEDIRENVSRAQKSRKTSVLRLKHARNSSKQTNDHCRSLLNHANKEVSRILGISEERMRQENQKMRARVKKAIQFEQKRLTDEYLELMVRISKRAAMDLIVRDAHSLDHDLINQSIARLIVPQEE